MTSYFSESQLLAPPTDRAAFSDRQAYVCAELSKLAYFKFEGGHSIEQVVAIAKGIIGSDARFPQLEQQLRTVLSSSPSTAAEGALALSHILRSANFDLVKTFSTQGTQAFFCTKKVTLESSAQKTVAFLAFRGTEPKDFRDIKSDVKAALRKIAVDGEEIELHSGYLDAFELVRADIQSTLQQTPHDQLFITGHSLGGALAIVTTRLLAASSNGACYTFGAPPIGTVDVQNKLKTPVYEIINEIDIVPRLPNPWLTSGIVLLLRLLRLIAKLFTVVERLLASGSWDERLETFMASMTRYCHPGYVSYLVGTGNAARLRYNVSGYERLGWWLSLMWKRRIWQFKKMVDDHSIDEYVTKLKFSGLSRQ